MIFAILQAFLYALAGYYLVRLPAYFMGKRKYRSQQNGRDSLMLIFGSGGHTTELLMTFKNFDFQKWKRIYFVKAESDVTSENKIKDYLKTNKVITLDLYIISG